MKQDLSLFSLWQAFVRYWKLVVLLPIFSALAIILISIFLITPLYESSTLLLVKATRPIDRIAILHQDIRIARSLTDTYSEIIHSQIVLEEVIINLGLPYSVEQLRVTEQFSFEDFYEKQQTKLKVELVPDTELISIIVTSPDPQLASEIANEVARVSMEKIYETMSVENIRVVEKARVSKEPFSPKITINVIMAFSIGLMAALAITLLSDYLDRTIKDPSEVTELLDLPIIGIIPKTEDEKVNLIETNSIQTEAFRTLRTNIQFSRVDKQNKQILITGANPKCGKSTVAINLATVLARSGASVLLIDADLHRPTLHHYLNEKNSPGLSTLVVEENPNVKIALQKSSFESLMFLPSGPIPRRPAELLASERMKKLAIYFADQFDYVIYDTPPILAVTDAAVLSKLVDGIVFVLDYGRATKDEVVVAVDLLNQVQANIIGVVVNFVPYKKSQYLDYQHYNSNKPIKFSSWHFKTKNINKNKET